VGAAEEAAASWLSRRALLRREASKAWRSCRIASSRSYRHPLNDHPEKANEELISSFSSSAEVHYA